MQETLIKVSTNNPEFNAALEQFVYAMVNKFQRVDHKHGDRSVVRQGYEMRELSRSDDGIFAHLRDEVKELSDEMLAERIDPASVQGEAIDVSNMAFLLYWKGIKSSIKTCPMCNGKGKFYGLGMESPGKCSKIIITCTNCNGVGWR